MSSPLSAPFHTTLESEYYRDHCIIVWAQIAEQLDVDFWSEAEKQPNTKKLWTHFHILHKLQILAASIGIIEDDHSIGEEEKEKYEKYVNEEIKKLEELL